MKTLFPIVLTALILLSCTEEEISPKHYNKQGAKQSKVKPNEDGRQSRPVTPFEK